MCFKLILICVLLSTFNTVFSSIETELNSDECNANLVETIPIGLTYNSSITTKDTFKEMIALISSATTTLDIASFYWSLLGTDVMPHPDNSSIKGKEILDTIVTTTRRRDLITRIVVNQTTTNNTDLQLLASVANIRQLNFTRLIGAGVLHTKFIIVDQKHVYIGSANMDWRSLTHVKEMGVVLYNCSVLANDLIKIFQVYWYLGTTNATIPKSWPQDWSTNYNKSNPLSLSINEKPYNVFMSSSPKSFCPNGRTNDISAILSIIRNANKYIYIAVMDYYPQYLYSNYRAFWPLIDNELRKAVIDRKVNVRLLASHWNNTRKSMPLFLKSLAAFNDSSVFGAHIECKLFVVPAFTPQQADIPFARVNHNKYMVTDQTAYIGTSNWSADYFVNTAGVGIAITPTNSSHYSIRDQLQEIFERDWNSSYANIYKF
ncbi:5'-3' exonuclease PLD3-like [Oppia nitens]|uniref:5'-3' exonuclease PLD3-like n=1 Tax=Oppia nitens TaxID=1686743 RepID=UPI0023DCCDB5|nr:5'-3' exonuclease PLD3-like [Oppia nitens]